MSSPSCRVLFSLFICVLLQQPSKAIKQASSVSRSHSFGPNPSLYEVKTVANSQYNLLGSYLGSIDKAKEAIFYSYSRYINGFAAVLDEEEAAKCAENPDVVTVFLNKERQLHTTHSWDFLGLESNGVYTKSSIWRETLGEDIIIGNLDSGVWPESKSFSDEGMWPVPERWRGFCQINEENNDTFRCNRKLIGARYFYKGFLAAMAQEPDASFISARDHEGHGTHTLSTAGGNFVAGASAFGNGNGTAKGGSPKARVASYKVCWPSPYGSRCFDADILAGFEAAISDGVDVLSVSLGSVDPSEYFESGISIGSFHANAHGIIVVNSAGNEGPSPATLASNEPWVLTVAASTIDREFTSYVTLGDKKIIKGASLSESSLPSNNLYPLMSAADAVAAGADAVDALHCEKGTLDPEKVKGKILVCLRGGHVGKVEKGVEAASAGAAGMILANDQKSGNKIEANLHVLPASLVNFMDGNYIFNYINHTKSPVAHISRVKTELGIKPAPIVAGFSSRGPNVLEPAILKPDITAPGVDIIAAYTEATYATEESSDKRITPFTTLSGTSMSCPHVAGLAGLLKSLHPDWSPAAIKSAIMTSARKKDNSGKPILDSTLEKATPFAYGAGHIQPNHAVDPGLVYDLKTTDYLNLLCGRGYNSSVILLFNERPYHCPNSFNIADFNYPSITTPRIDFGHSLNVTRTLTNVGSPSTYKVRIKAPKEVLISVEPDTLSFKEKGEKREFRVTLTMKSITKAEYLFGSIDWSDGMHHVRSPIVVKGVFEAHLGKVQGEQPRTST
ncbi:subtilisin-like protease SBT5.4 isoform X2 [Gastrolobium bilobum]|uniref:subtilisin-like protease SBT5.4 isoform X2 n=1 Tax=Gastrolobium bilobum TaxID=150636 RepID=UPI002AB10ECD|nr:subtilisin-like protease SBT5.4 isoform X2 [Gastrolobium bilobum]